MASIQETIGNYRLVAKLASGSFGHVYRGEHTILTNRIVAIKLMHDVNLSSQKERDSFIREARLLEQLRHPYILPIIDVGFHESCPYIVTEYAPNGSLRNRLQRHPHKPFPQEEALTILSQIGQALHHAHQQKIVHRDLKPENILFNAKGEAVLADFGVATVLSTLSMQQSSLVGTPMYMAPEQFKGKCGKESDQYALGCIAYELFTGQKPFTGSDLFSMAFQHLQEAPVPPRQLNAKVPVHIEQAILKAMAKERADRYADVSAFVTALCKSVGHDARTSTFTTASPEPVSHDVSTPPFTTVSCEPVEVDGDDPTFTTALYKTKEQWVDDGVNLYKSKRYREALAAYDEAIELDANYAWAYYNKGNALSGLQDYDEALTIYEHTIRLTPHDVLVWLYKAWTLTALGRYEEALAAYEQAIELDPNSALAYNGKGIALSNLHRYPEALAAYDEAMRLGHNDVFTWSNKGKVLIALGRYEEALAAYDEAIRLDPKSADYYYGKGLALSGLQHYSEALVAYEHAISLKPQDAKAYHEKGMILKRLGRTKEAQQAYDRARQLGHGK